MSRTWARSVEGKTWHVAWQKAHPDLVRRYKKTYRETHKEEVRAYGTLYHRTHREQKTASARARRERKFGVRYPSETDCEVCGRHLVGPQIFLDHDHNTERFRAWLCIQCNGRIGWLERHLHKILKLMRVEK